MHKIGDKSRHTLFGGHEERMESARMSGERKKHLDLRIKNALKI